MLGGQPRRLLLMCHGLQSCGFSPLEQEGTSTPRLLLCAAAHQCPARSAIHRRRTLSPGAKPATSQVWHVAANSQGGPAAMTLAHGRSLPRQRWRTGGEWTAALPCTLSSFFTAPASCKALCRALSCARVAVRSAAAQRSSAFSAPSSFMTLLRHLGACCNCAWGPRRGRVSCPFPTASEFCSGHHTHPQLPVR